MKKVLTTLFFLPVLVFSQTERQIDSLERIYNSSVLEDKLKIVDRLFELYIYHSPEKVRPELKKLLEESERENSINGRVHAYKNYMALYNVQSKFDSTIFYGNKALELIPKTGDSLLYSTVNQNLIWSYSILGDFKKAEQLSIQDLEISKKLNNWDVLSKSYFGLGNTYFYQNRFPEAIRAYIKVDSILDIHDPYQKTLVNNNINIAQLLIIQKDFEKASVYIDKAEKVSEHNGHDYGLATVNLYRGIIEKERGNPQKGIDFLLKAKEFLETFESDYDLAEIYYYLGDCYFELKDYESAELYHNKSLPLQKKVQNPLGVANSNLTLGKIDLENGNPSSAQLKFITALEIYNELNDPSVIEHKGEIFRLLSSTYESQKSFELALQQLKNHLAVKDTLIKNRNRSIFQELEAKYQTEKKEQEIALLSAQNKLIDQRRKNQKYIYIGLLGLFLAIAGLLFYGYRNKLKTAQRIKELDTLKSRFFANVSHEFRTPLALIKSPVQQLRAISDGKDQKQLELIDKNADRMLELVDQLLELSRIEGGYLNIVLKKGNVSSFLNALLEPFQFQAKEEGIPFEVDVQVSEGPDYFDRDILTKIVVNLLSNAFKYRGEGPVTFISRIHNEKLELEIENYNDQVKEKDLPRFFERFYQKDGTAVGFGIGLALVKNLVTICEGSIHAGLDKGKVIISVEMPLKKDLKDAILIEENNDSHSDQQVQAIEIESDEVPVLLIADDHPDIRTVLKDVFKEDFTILEASNGEEAFKLAQKEIPDMVISDVMMPKKDGYALVKALKEDEITSSVPIVLLTAKAGDEARLKSLQTHADGYLTKPFNHKIVKATVHQLLHERKKLQERYSRELILRPVDIAINTADERFIQRLETVMDAELTNPDFTTDEFASRMNLSRMQLHRKLKSLLGVSATEFVRNERLKAAAELLKNPKLSIAEVAYSSGFNEATYFSKCFKDIYGLSPSDFRKTT